MQNPSPAQVVRQELKAKLGFNSRQVSVRGTRGSVIVTIKVPGVSHKAVADIAFRALDKGVRISVSAASRLHKASRAGLSRLP